MVKKKILVGLFAGVLISAVAISGTIAWLTDKDEAQNKFTIGNVDIQINEDYDEEEDGTNIYPGKEVKKVPTVENIGKNPAYIRVKVAIDSNIAEFLTIDYQLGTDSTQWFYENGYYYYNSIVAPGDSTDEIFNHFTLSSSYIETNSNTSYKIDVYAEAIQSQAFEQATGETFRDAILRAFAAYDAQP